MNKEELIRAIGELFFEKMQLGDYPTNGDMIKAIFPKVIVLKLMSSFDKGKLLGYRTWLGGHSQDYFLDWWNAPYDEKEWMAKKEEE